MQPHDATCCPHSTHYHLSAVVAEHEHDDVGVLRSGDRVIEDRRAVAAQPRPSQRLRACVRACKSARESARACLFTSTPLATVVTPPTFAAAIAPAIVITHLHSRQRALSVRDGRRRSPAQ
jgi:anti-sigma factor RsiW